LARVPHMNNGMTYWKFVVLAYVRIEAHYIYILNSFPIPYLVVVTHGLCPP
jgi:hypothetical protein